MRIRFIVSLIFLLTLGACKKSSGPINYSCSIDGSTMTGNAVTLYNGYQFQVLMNGSNGEAVSLIWYGIDSIKQLTPRTYTIPANALPPAILAGAFQAPGGQEEYITGGGNNLGGTVTILKNTGPGGVISGTFSFNALNTAAYLYDTVYVTSGTFTDVYVVSN
jgi:hypothetical protein